MGDPLDIDKIEAAPRYFEEGGEGTVVALCRELRACRAERDDAIALAESRPDITPDVAVAWTRPVDTRMSREQRLADECEAALYEHARKAVRR